MLRSIAFLVASSASYLVVAHPHCHYDLREVDLDGKLSFCSMDYAPNGICCTGAEEAELEATVNAAGDLTEDCADYYYQMICGVCGSYSGHLYERLALTLGVESGLTMKSDFCEGFTSACAGQIDFPDYDGVGYCTMHTGGSDDLFWSYPYEESGAFTGDYTLMFPDLDMPSITVAMHQSPDGSMYWIAGKDGQLVRVDTDSTSTSTTVMDFSDSPIFLTSFEEGLLDFAFSPMFDDNNLFYVSWTVNEPFDRNRLSKFQYYEGDPDATLNSEELLIETDPRAKFLHNGGWLGFKPSDYGGKAADYHDLYWAVGDSGPQEDPYNNGQRTDVHFGSVVRISVPSSGTGYEIPSGNYPGAELPELCAIGFRNNWRCGFDRLTDDLYCGDVGHINIESVKKIECGNNYGWARFEGSRCTEYSEDDYGPCADADRSGLTLPYFEYCHDSYDSSPSSEDDYTGGNDLCGDRSIIGSCVIGGYVYRGQAYQDVLYGAYIFGDHQTGDIYYIFEGKGGSKTTGTVLNGGLKIFSFAEDNNGELYMIGSDNNIYIMPCGEPCDEAPIPGPPPDTPDDDGSTSTKTSSDDGGSTSTKTSSDDGSSTSTKTSSDDGGSTSTVIPSDDDQSSTYEYLGCFNDNNADRVMSGMVLDHFDEMTTETCAGFCMGSAYFGTQYSYQCFCGLATDDPTFYGPTTCTYACAGDPTQTCGGKDTLSVYAYVM